MANRHLFWVLTTCIPLWAGGACARSSGANDYARRLASEVERRTVPPGATALLLVHSDTSGCAIRTQWTFANSWDHAKYAAWLNAQLSPEFNELQDSTDHMTFSRHEDGDAHSLAIEISPLKDSLRVRITLCVYPD